MDKLTNDDWYLIKDSLEYYNHKDADELLDKINGIDFEEEFDFEEHINLNNLYWRYVELFPNPGMTKELDEDFFTDKILLVTHKVETYGGEIYYGKLRGHNIYIKLDDNPGSSGYDCCGYIRLTYSDDKELIE